MAIPFLYGLPQSARAALPFVQRGVREGLSSRQITAAIRAGGLPISRTRSVLPLMRRLQAMEAAGRNIRNIPKGNTINVNKLPQALTRLRRDFSYQVRVVGRDAFGNAVDRYLTVTTDSNNLTPGDIEQAAEDLVSTEGQSETVFEVKATLQSGMRQSQEIF